MRIIKNNNIYEQQSRNLVQAELSNMAMVAQSPFIPVTYFSIDPNLSERVPGFKSVQDYIGPESTVAYNLIENVPIAGISSLSQVNEYDDEIGLSADYTSEGLVVANSIQAKPGDCFIVPDRIGRPALYTIYNIKHMTAKDIPSIGIEFRLLTVSENSIRQIYNQVVEYFMFTVSSLGSDKNAVITNKKYYELRDLITVYTNIVYMYKDLFFVNSRGLFLFKGYDNTNGTKCDILDIILHKMMFEEDIICYDNVIVYANNNYEYDSDKIYIDSPETISSYDYQKCILYNIIKKKKKPDSLIRRYPSFIGDDEQITKYISSKNYTVERYVEIPEDNFSFSFELNIFTDEVISNITNCKTSDECNTLLDAIIMYYNDIPFDFNDIIIEDDYDGYNYYLIPIFLYIMKVYLINLEKGI